MKVEFYPVRRNLRIIFLVSICINIYCLCVIAQISKESAEDQLLPPSEEIFQEADETVAPWRDGGCEFIDFHYYEYEPDCYSVKRDDIYRKADTLTLYNEDSTIWYRFSIAYGNPDNFRLKPKFGFLPMTSAYMKHPYIVVLRMVGESAHWYKVEVNEETQATKFVLKSDPMWVKKKWSHWLYMGVHLTVGEDQSFLRDKPNGKVIEETANRGIKSVNIIKVEGEWVYVSGEIPRRPKGWIRWRNGRKVIVGWLLNSDKVPETKADVESK